VQEVVRSIPHRRASLLVAEGFTPTARAAPQQFEAHPALSARIGAESDCRAYAFWSHAQAVALKRLARGDEGRRSTGSRCCLRGLAQPAQAGFALVAEGFTPTATVHTGFHS
jgi:hypothetical protein